MSAWWEVEPRLSVLILDEVHIRSVAYPELFQMVWSVVATKQVKLVIMSATLPPLTLEDFFGQENCGRVELRGRLFPLYRFEPAEPWEFETDQMLADALVELAIDEALTHLGSILIFVRGQFTCLHLGVPVVRVPTSFYFGTAK